MRRRDFLGLAAAAAASPQMAIAQQAPSLPRIALLSAAVPPADMAIAGTAVWAEFIRHMATLGFVEGRSVVYERYQTPGVQAEANARKIVQSAPDVIFCGPSTTTALVILRMTQAIPVVVLSGDLLVAGAVTNLARPGANVTGISSNAGPDSEGKMLALVAEAVPAARTVAYTNSGNTGIEGQFSAIKQGFVQSVAAAAARLGLKLNPIVIPSGAGEADFAEVFGRIALSKAEMVLFGTDPYVQAHVQLATQWALASRLPTMASFAGFCEAGGLLSYGSNNLDNYRKAAGYVAQILGGANPGELPVQQPTVFDFVINVKTAKAIGVDIPRSLLIQATEVIE